MILNTDILDLLTIPSIKFMEKMCSSKRGWKLDGSLFFIKPINETSCPFFYSLIRFSSLCHELFFIYRAKLIDYLQKIKFVDIDYGLSDKNDPYKKDWDYTALHFRLPFGSQVGKCEVGYRSFRIQYLMGYFNPFYMHKIEFIMSSYDRALISTLYGNEFCTLDEMNQFRNSIFYKVGHKKLISGNTYGSINDYQIIGSCLMRHSYELEGPFDTKCIQCKTFPVCVNDDICYYCLNGVCQICKTNNAIIRSYSGDGVDSTDSLISKMEIKCEMCCDSSDLRFYKKSMNIEDNFFDKSSFCWDICE